MRKLVLIILSVWVIDAKEVYATFNVVAKKSANLAFNISGVVEKINVDIGSVVKKGDVIAKLKSDDIKANVELANIALTYAQKDFNRAKKAADALNRAKQDSIEFRYKSAKAKLLYTKAVYQKSFLKAPFDGIITAKYIEIGDGISAMPPKTAFKLETLHKKKLILEFDQKYFSSVKVGDKFLYSFDGQSEIFEGKIDKLYPVIDPKNAKAKAEVKVSDVPSGLFGTGKIIIGN